MSYEKAIRGDEKAILKFRSLFSRYGYTQYKMSKFEEYDLYVRNKDFLISNEIITFTDMTGKLLALKPDVTLSIIKDSRGIPGEVEKVYYNENVYRVTKSSKVFREIMQTGLECIGDVGAYEIYETLLLAAKSLEIISENFVLDISHMGLLSAILERIDAASGVKAEITSLIAQKNEDGLAELCRENAFGEKETRALICIVSTYGDIKTVMEELKSIDCGAGAKEETEKLAAVLTPLLKSGYERHINIDFSIVNDMKYYNGVVFKGYIEGIPQSVLSGGQYDKLMRRMGKSAGAIGFAVYLDMIERMDKNKDEFDVDALLLYNDRAELEKIAEAVEALGRGGTVLAQKKVPQNIRYKKLFTLDERGTIRQ